MFTLDDGDQYLRENLEENLQYHVRHTAGVSCDHPKHKIQLKTMTMLFFFLILQNGTT